MKLKETKFDVTVKNVKPDKKKHVHFPLSLSVDYKKSNQKKEGHSDILSTTFKLTNDL